MSSLESGIGLGGNESIPEGSASSRPFLFVIENALNEHLLDTFDIKSLGTIEEPVVKEILLTIASTNPLDDPIISSRQYSSYPVLLKDIMSEDVFKPITDIIAMNPVIQILQAKLHELFHAQQQSRLRQGHPQLEENIVVVKNVVLWQMLNNQYTETMGNQAMPGLNTGSVPDRLSWEGLAKTLEHRLHIKTSKIV